MKSTRILQVASILALLQFGAHTLLFVSAAPKHGQDEIALVEAMKTHRFDFVGSTRSYWDFYFGYGLLAAFSVFIEAVLLWQLSALAKHDPVRIKPIVALLIVSNVGHAVFCLRYFFITPIVPDVAIAVCLAWALAAAGAASAPTPVRAADPAAGR